MKKLVARYPDADKIVLIQDNLNTHNPSSFYAVPGSAYLEDQYSGSGGHHMV